MFGQFLQRRANLALVCALLLFLSSGIVSFHNISVLASNNEWVLHTHQVREELQNLRANLVSARSEARGYLATGQDRFVQGYRTQSRELTASLSRARNLTRDNPSQQLRLNRLEQTVSKLLSALNEEMANRSSSQQLDQLIQTAQQQVDEAQSLTSEMMDEEGRLLAQRSDEVRTSSRRTLMVIASFALIALGIIVVASWYIDQGTRQKQRDHERISNLNLELESRAQKLTESNKELEAFTYSVSHDLRAPLRHIDGFSKMLVEAYGQQLDEEGREYLTLIRDSTREMGQLVDDLLGLARVGRTNLTLQLTGLDSIVEGVVSDLKRANNERALEWKIEKLPFVECDAGLMRQVFTNFLSNAVKFTRPRERAIIHVGTTKQAGNSVIFVRDNGVGFNIKHAEKLFGVFQRLHRQEDFEGTGVGLATVQRIIQKHGGRVWAEAAVDQGATFYFTIGSAPPPGPTNIQRTR